MKNQFVVAFGIGLACVGLVVAGVLFMQRGARVGLTGSVLKVRTAPLDDNSSVVVLDFRFTNPGNVLFVVRGLGCLSWMTTVYLSLAVAESTWAATLALLDEAGVTLTKLTVKATSSAVISCPSLHMMPWRSLMVRVLKSAL